MTEILFSMFRLLEKIGERAQGKGWGAATIKQEVGHVLQVSNPDPILAIDVGGNIGDYSAELRRRIPSLEIHIFEPAKTNVEILQKKFAIDLNVKIKPVGLSDHERSASLYADVPGSGMGSLVDRKLNHINMVFQHKEDVNLICFEDYWVGELKGRPIDIVKLDIEGHELNALKGFGSAIAAVKVVQFEFGGCNIDTRTFFRDFYDYFNNHGFRMFRITPLGLQPVLRYQENYEYFSTTNYIAVRTD